MSRLLALGFLLLATSFAIPTGAVGAAPASVVANAAEVKTKDAGAIDGEVVSVDYRTGHFSVKAGGMTYDIVVLPSTDFQGPTNAFRGITDIKKGAHVSVMLSQRASTYTAQIIHLR